VNARSRFGWLARAVSDPFGTDDVDFNLEELMRVACAQLAMLDRAANCYYVSA
jgi:hypothetical protein